MTEMFKLNCTEGDRAQVVRMCDKPHGECEKRTLGLVVVVRNCLMQGSVPVWAYDGPPHCCAQCWMPFNTLPDANLMPFPKLAPDEQEQPYEKEKPRENTRSIPHVMR